jgi:hypothetical protein
MTFDEKISAVLNELDKHIGKDYSELKFSVVEAQEMVKLEAKCLRCPKIIEVRLWYKHDKWPEHMLQDFFKEALIHTKNAHKPLIVIPKSFGGKNGRMMH